MRRKFNFALVIARQGYSPLTFGFQQGVIKITIFHLNFSSIWTWSPAP